MNTTFRTWTETHCNVCGIEWTPRVQAALDALADGPADPEAAERELEAAMAATYGRHDNCQS